MTRRKTVAPIAWALVLAHISALAAHGGQEAVGELRIEGQGIEQLILTGPGDQTITFEPPGATATLPPGDYVVHGIRLEGGHSSQAYMIPDDLQVTVSSSSPATLKIGAPLRQAVQVERRGSMLILDYELIGQGGERYGISRSLTGPQPAFTVYRGDRKVASGEFEFG